MWADNQAYVTSLHNDTTRSGTYLLALLKYAITHLPHSWTLLYRVIERFKGLRWRVKLGSLRMNIANRFLKGQVRWIGCGADGRWFSWGGRFGGVEGR